MTTDYQFVDGDISKIKRDGNIMPLRSDAAVRGEDIAFALEAIGERSCAPTNIDPHVIHNFSRRILANQPWLVASTIRSMANSGVWLDSQAVYRPSVGDTFAACYPGAEIDPSGLDSDPDEFYVGAPLKSAPIAAIYNDLARLDTFRSSAALTSPTAATQTIVVDNPSSEGVHYNPPAYHSGRVWQYEATVINGEYYAKWVGSGAVKYSASGSNTIVKSQYASSVTNVLVWLSVSGYRDSVNYNYCGLSPVSFSQGSSGITVANSAIASAAEAFVTSTCGISLFVPPAPSASEESSHGQSIQVLAGSAIPICTLRNRTRW